jgi:hypothetical protein
VTLVRRQRSRPIEPRWCVRCVGGGARGVSGRQSNAPAVQRRVGVRMFGGDRVPGALGPLGAAAGATDVRNLLKRRPRG